MRLLCMWSRCTKRLPSISTRDDVSSHLVHESLPSDRPHEFIWFGCHEVSERLWEVYGVERSISVLEDWYERNTNGEDAILD